MKGEQKESWSAKGERLDRGSSKNGILREEIKEGGKEERRKV